MADVKPGYKTSEFYKNLLMQVVGVLTLLHVTTPGVTKALQGWVDVASLAAMVIANVGYYVSRTNVKKAASIAAADIAHGRFLELARDSVVLDTLTGTAKYAVQVVQEAQAEAKGQTPAALPVAPPAPPAAVPAQSTGDPSQKLY